MKLYALLRQLDFEYVVHFRSDVLVTPAKGETKTAGEWVPEGGRAKLLKGARVTAARAEVPTVVCFKREGLKEGWWLVTNCGEATAQELLETTGA